MIDTHTHLNDKVYSECQNQVLLDAKANGINHIIDVGWNLLSSEKSACFASENRGVSFLAGIHPSDCESVDNGVIDRLFELLQHEKAVGMGEIGLDYHYGKDNREQQKKAFDTQISLANKAGLPFVVHSREASKDMADILTAKKSEINHEFLMHCYSESREMAKIYLDLGANFAFGGAITFKNAKKEDIIRYIPKDRLFCETDCPYMAPVPLRGTVNNPSNVKYVYQKMAEILNIDLQEFIQQVKNNVKRLFFKIKL